MSQLVAGGSRKQERRIVILEAAIVGGLILGFFAGMFSSIPAAAQAGWMYAVEPSRYGLTPMFALPVIFGAYGAVVGVSIGALIGCFAFLPWPRQHAREAPAVPRVYSTSRAKPVVP